MTAITKDLNFCKTTYENECLSILGSSVAMHTGCAAIDAVLLGAICHAGVIVWGIAERNKALAAYEACH